MADTTYYENDGTSSSTISKTTKSPTIEKSNKSNPLNSYSSYNYVFTLASLRREALTDPDSYRDSNNFFVIAKSSGKGTKGLSSKVSTITKFETEDIKDRGGNIIAKKTKTYATDTATGEALVKKFNQESPGRFDFYLNNVRIETIMGFNEKTSLAVATSMEFDVMEPYSMSGFIEALQVSAVAAGYEQYTLCPYLLKMEFWGYPDGEEIAETAKIVENSTRYFIFGFASIDIDVTEVGAKYKCTGVPFNEKGFGQPSTLLANVSVTGNTVGEILKSFEKSLNDTKKKEAGSEGGVPQASRSDSYEIIFPKVGPNGIIKGEDNRTIADSKVVELLKTNAIYAFDPPASENENNAETTRAGASTTKASPSRANIVFAENSKVQECIVSVILNSDYVKNILKELSNPDTKIIDPYGMVDYYIVNLEVEDKGFIDNKTNKPFYHYRYIILPYKIHYSRIPLAQNSPIDTSKLIQVANRTYNYLYTGSNLDIKSFQLKFNSLFFQAIPKAMGNKPDGYYLTSESVESTAPSTTSISGSTTNTRTSSPNGVAKVLTDTKLSSTHVANTPNAGQRIQSDPYDDLARNMHQAILDNVDQCLAEIEIIGDPYYLVTGGIGNYRPTTNIDGTVGEGEAPYTSGDVIIVLIFRNPVDISETTGEAIFNDKVTPYSGAFRLLTVAHTFVDGVFTQKLSLVRIPGQVNIDTNTQIGKRSALIDSKENESQAPTARPPAPANTVRKAGDNLLYSLANGALPSTGLPGSLSKLASTVGGTLAGVTAGVTTVGTLFNTVSGGSGSALQGLAGASTALRLASSGLSGLTTNINSAGASINSLATVAQSAGISSANVKTLADTALAAGQSSISEIGTNALSAVKNLGSQASGLVSSVSSKIDLLKGSPAATLANQLGVDTSKLSGLSSNLQSNFVDKMTAAVKDIPNGVDLSASISKGLILNNVPLDALKNLPVSQPAATAPFAAVSLKDIKSILDQGGSLKNIPGASTIPGVADLLKSASTIKLGETLGADLSALSGKLSTVQAGLGSITGQALSVEASLNNISSKVSGSLPNIASNAMSVVNKFGSVSSLQNSPLDILMKSKA
jgi:hypothetical protein